MNLHVLHFKFVVLSNIIVATLVTQSFIVRIHNRVLRVVNMSYFTNISYVPVFPYQRFSCALRHGGYIPPYCREFALLPNESQLQLYIYRLLCFLIPRISGEIHKTILSMIVRFEMHTKYKSCINLPASPELQCLPQSCFHVQLSNPPPATSLQKYCALLLLSLLVLHCTRYEKLVVRWFRFQ